MIYVFAVSGVSAEWVDDSFTSLRVSLPGGSTHRITYTSVNESNAAETKTVTTNSISHVVEGLNLIGSIVSWSKQFL